MDFILSYNEFDFAQLSRRILANLYSIYVYNFAYTRIVSVICKNVYSNYLLFALK